MVHEYSPLGIDFPLLNLTKGSNRGSREGLTRDQVLVQEDNSRPQKHEIDGFVISPGYYQFKNREWVDITNQIA